MCCSAVRGRGIVFSNIGIVSFWMVLLAKSKLGSKGSQHVFLERAGDVCRFGTSSTCSQMRRRNSGGSCSRRLSVGGGFGSMVFDCRTFGFHEGDELVVQDTCRFWDGGDRIEGLKIDGR